MVKKEMTSVKKETVHVPKIQISQADTAKKGCFYAKDDSCDQQLPNQMPMDRHCGEFAYSLQKKWSIVKSTTRQSVNKQSYFKNKSKNAI